MKPLFGLADLSRSDCKICVGWAESSSPTIVSHVLFGAMVGLEDSAHPTASSPTAFFTSLEREGY